MHITSYTCHALENSFGIRREAKKRMGHANSLAEKKTAKVKKRQEGPIDKETVYKITKQPQKKD